MHGYYYSEVGRFIEVDPKWDKYPGWSPYVYCRDNPVIRIDPDGLTDIEILIFRIYETEQSTMGSFIVVNSASTDVLVGTTLELPDRNNKKFASRIMGGEYKAVVSERWEGDSKGETVIRLENRNNREGILIHTANTPSELEGCIGIGNNMPAENRIGNSGETMDKLLKYIENIISIDRSNNEETNMLIRIFNINRDKEEENEKDKY